LSSRAYAVLSRLHSAFRARAGIHPVLPVLVVASFVMLFALDPFGVEAASHARSEQATLRIMAPSYRPSGLVTAIVIDDEFISRRQSGWPLRYGEQGRLMRAVLAAKPDVLLIDLVYPHRHGTAPSPALADEAHQLLDPILKAGDTPIVFTAMAQTPEQLARAGRPSIDFCRKELRPGPDTLLDTDSVQPQLRELLASQNPNMPGSRVRQAYIRWSGCGDRYPLLLDGNPNTITPAFAAFRAYCERHPRRAQCKTNDPADFLQPMIVRSGAFPPATQAFAYDESTCQKPGRSLTGEVSLWRRARATVQQLSLGIFKDLRTDPNHELSLPCPAVTVVPLSTLETATPEEWRELLEGKAVLIGAHLSGYRDIVNAPVHGQIPGVLWHAMALDNLLSLGSGYLADRHKDMQRIVQIALIAIFAYLFPYIVWLIEHSRVKTSMAATSLGVWLALALVHLSVGHFATAAIALGIGVALDLTRPTASAGYFVAVLAAALGSVFFLWQGWPPGNWFGLVILVIAFSHTIKPYYRGEGRKQFPHRASVLGSLLNRKEIAHE
jgi:hypothetical protein